MAAVIGALRGVLSMDSAAFDSGAKRAQATMGTVERRMVRLAGGMEKAGRRMALGLTLPMVAASAVAVKSSLKIVDAQAKMAQSLGTTVASMQVLQRAGDLAGVSMGEVEQATSQLTKRLSQAAGGTGAAAKALTRLHLSATDLQQLPLDERVAAIQDALAAYVPAAERAAVASDLFGSRAGVIFTRIDGATLRTAAADVNRFGVAVSEVDADRLELANDAMSRLGLAGRGLANQLTVALVPALQSLSDKGASVAEWFASLDERGQRFTAGMAVAAAAIGPVTLGLGIFIKASVPVLKGILAITTAARAMGVAMWAAAGPWGILAGVVAAAGAAYVVFGEKSKTFQDTMDELDAAQDTLNTQVAAFATTYAPSAGKAAIDAANDYLEAAKAAREFAAAQLASDTAEATRIEKMVENGHLRNLTLEEQAKISARLHGAQSRLAVSQEAYNKALAARDETVKRVMSSDGEMVEGSKRLNSEIEISVDSVNGLGGSMSGATEKAKELSFELEGPLSSAVDSVANSFGDWVADGFRDFESMWDGMKATAKRGLADLASTFANNKLQLFLGVSASGSGTAATAASSVAGAAGGSGGGLFSGLLGNAASGFLGGGGALSGLGSGLGGVLSGGGLGSSFANLGGLLSGSVGGWGALGAAIPAVGVIVGAAALLKSAFSRKYVGSGIRGSFGADGFTGSSIDFYKGGAFRSNRTDYKPLETGFEAVLDEGMQELTAGVKDMAKGLGLGTKALKDFTGEGFTLWTNGKSAEQVQQELQAEISKTADEMAELVLGTDDYSRAGEGAIDTLTRLSGSLAAVNDAADLLGHSLFDISLQGGDAASHLTDLFGGADAMAAASNTYFSAFYSEGERSEIVLRRLGEEFEKLGVAMPASRDGFREVVEGLDTSTEAGREMYAGMLKLSGAMNEVLPQIGQFSAEVQGIVDQIGGEIGLQIEGARDMAANAKAAAELWYRTAGSLREFVTGLVGSELSGASRAQAAEAQRARLQSAFAAAQGGDVEAAQQIPELARAYLQAARAQAGSALEYRRLAADVQAQVSFAAGVAELEGANDDILRGLYEQQIEVLTGLGNFLQLEGLTDEQVSELSQGVQDLAADWDGTVGAFETSLGALEDAIKSAEAFSYDDLVGALDVAVTLDDGAPGWLKELVAKSGSGIRTTLDFVIRRDDLSAADRWIAVNALSEHIATIDFVVGSDLDAGTKRLALETAGKLQRDLHLSLGRDLDAETRQMVLTRAATLSRRVNVALTAEGSATVKRLNKLQDLIGTSGSGKVTFDGGVKFAPDAAFKTLFGGLSSSAEGLVQPLNSLRTMLGSLRDQVQKDRDAREAQSKILSLQMKGAGKADKLAASQQGAADLIGKIEALEASTGISLQRKGGKDAILRLNSDGTIKYAADYTTGGAGLAEFNKAFRGANGLEAQIAAYNKKITGQDGALEKLRAQIRGLGGIPAFAAGGAHSGGVRLVGERGWEIENTGPSRIHSHAESVAMLDNRKVVESVDGLTKHVVSQGQLVRVLMDKVVSFLDEWNDDGLPGERA